MKYKVYYAVIAEVEAEVDADSFEEAYSKVMTGKEKIIDTDPVEVLDGTNFSFVDEKENWKIFDSYGDEEVENGGV